MSCVRTAFGALQVETPLALRGMMQARPVLVRPLFLERVLSYVLVTLGALRVETVSRLLVGAMMRAGLFWIVRISWRVFEAR